MQIISKNVRRLSSYRAARAVALLHMIEDTPGFILDDRTTRYLSNRGWTHVEVEHAVDDLLESARAVVIGTGPEGISLTASPEEPTA